MKKRKIAVIVGSITDLTQTRIGLEILKANSKDIDIVGVYVRSQHRNTLEVQELLKKLVEMEVDAVIVGAGWANHLTGCCDAFLRYTLQDYKLVVIGVAFEDEISEKNDVREKHDKAAILSITEVPGTQVVYSYDGQNFVGLNGFVNACAFAITQELPKINPPKPKDALDLTIEDALITSQR